MESGVGGDVRGDVKGDGAKIGREAVVGTSMTAGGGQGGIVEGGPLSFARYWGKRGIVGSSRILYAVVMKKSACDRIHTQVTSFTSPRGAQVLQIVLLVPISENMSYLALIPYTCLRSFLHAEHKRTLCNHSNISIDCVQLIKTWDAFKIVQFPTHRQKFGFRNFQEVLQALT